MEFLLHFPKQTSSLTVYAGIGKLQPLKHISAAQDVLFSRMYTFKTIQKIF